MRMRTTKTRPTHDPQTPPMALKGISSSVWPLYFHAARNRMCARQIDPQQTSIAKPDKARSQSKITGPAASKFKKARHPNAIMNATDGKGRPARSTHVKILGAKPCCARARSVRDPPYTEAMPRDRTDD